ncbi:hydantoinase B/oxoprolinase family protein [Saccharopolyspora sp. ASAGF58]|uniref:hydantoinase B/oxoprolinase family protein n=1 Tax=Saccharopolyspora sp. ASAGF58 TaxID=2719023 RepID=UPI00144016A6|nr:hydantoinase B/oxoprolinase family protein [Saccharopolyspora sp. ASAGF58]QIZ37252.1 hydantoinase B/oxoprolinase family protein [Saccharopolyspora sp. ASAGF58]
MRLSPSQLSVIKSGLDAIGREMAVNLRRSATSSIVREARDFSVALTDARGEVVAQAECIPIMTAGIALALRGIAGHVDLDGLTEDDALLMNDPYQGGQHLQDIYLLTPIFVNGELIGFGASTAHHVDIGGSHAGLSAHATELYQEGLRLPLSRFSVSRDFNDPNGFVRQVIAANVRVPDAVIGDLQAQFAANATATRRLAELVARHGRDEVLQAMADVKDYAEKRVRAAIESIPDGTYEATERFDASPWDGGTAEIIARVTVEGSTIDVDFTGSAEQILGNVNCPFASTVSSVQSAVRCMLDSPDIGFNEGCNRPITVSAPYGSVLNPRPPAAVRARLTPASRVFNAVIRALGQALPERAVATGFDTTTAIAVSKSGHDGYQVALEILGGGWGACAEHGGPDGLDNPISNCANAPVEALETDFDHFRIAEYALVEGSGGSGSHTGGRGIRRTYVATADGVSVAGYADRHTVGAEGINGGEPGGTGHFAIHRADGTVTELPCVYEETLNAGDRIVITTGGGGGYGAPEQEVTA